MDNLYLGEDKLYLNDIMAKDEKKGPLGLVQRPFVEETPAKRVKKRLEKKMSLMNKERSAQTAKEEAYEMGCNQGVPAGKNAYRIPEVATPDEAYRNMSEHYVQSAQYANHILPELRELAGYEDTTGAGTYTRRPNDEATHLYEEIVNEFWEGVYQGIEEGWKHADETGQ